MRARGCTIHRITGPNALVYENEYKIALRVGTKPPSGGAWGTRLGYDFHFMRQTDTGQWAEKQGCYGPSKLWDPGMTPDTPSNWEFDNHCYDSEIIYYAIGK